MFHTNCATSTISEKQPNQSQGNYEQATPLYQHALTIRERVLGPEHPDTALSLNNLAFLYPAQGNYEQATPLYQRALTVYERVLGLEHPDTPITRYFSTRKGLFRICRAGAYGISSILSTSKRASPFARFHHICTGRTAL